jgi:tetratricopeptide (TPR) repeat protein
LTLRLPYGGESGEHLMQEILAARPVPPRKLNPSLPADVETGRAELESDLGMSYANRASLALDQGDARLGAELAERAVACLRRARQANPEDTHYRDGLTVALLNSCEALLRQGDHERTAQALAEIEDLAPADARGLRLLAEGYARCAQNARSAGEPVRERYVELGLERLDRAVQGGWSDLDDLRGAPELETLRASPRFAALLERLEQGSR